MTEKHDCDYLRRMDLPYVPPGAFTPLELKEGSRKEFGQVWLCNDPTVDPATLNFPPQDHAHPFPPPPHSAPATFPELYLFLASGIGVQLSKMNMALLKMQQSYLALIRAGTPHPEEVFRREAPRNGLDDYMAAAEAFEGVLGIRGNRNKWWPLVPHNDGTFRNRTGWDKGRTNAAGQFVSNEDVPNGNFPVGVNPGRPKGLKFRVDNPGDNRPAFGDIIFVQDAEWALGALTETQWNSWAFVTNFSFSLYAPGADQQPRVVEPSSSSLVYYAASSSSPYVPTGCKKEKQD